MLTIEEVIAVGLVLSGKDTTADFGQNPHIDKIILQMNSNIVLVFTNRAVNTNGDLIGVCTTGRTLVAAVFYEHGHFFPNALRIGGDCQGFNRNLSNTHG